MRFVIQCLELCGAELINDRNVQGAFDVSFSQETENTNSSYHFFPWALALMWMAQTHLRVLGNVAHTKHSIW